MKRIILSAIFAFFVCTCGTPGTEDGGSCDQKEPKHTWVTFGLPAAYAEPVTVLGISGWLDSDGSELYSELGQRVKAKYGSKVAWQDATWDSWSQFALPGWDIVVGWSLGGDSAVRLVNFLKKHKEQLPKVLITICPRYQTDVKSNSDWDFGFIYDPGQMFLAPMKATYNFWSYGPLPSAPMTGALENVNVGLYGHMLAPEDPDVMAVFDKYMVGR